MQVKRYTGAVVKTIGGRLHVCLCALFVSKFKVYVKWTCNCNSLIKLKDDVRIYVV